MEKHRIHAAFYRKYAFIAADAVIDVLIASFFYFFGPVWIRQRLMPQRNEFRRAGLDHLPCHIRIVQFSLNKEGKPDSLFTQTLGHKKLASFSVICAGNRLIPYFIAATVQMHVDKSHAIHNLCYFDSFIFEGAPVRDGMYRRIFYGYWKLGPHALTDCFYKLTEEAKPVLQASAIFIGSMIPHF